MADIFAFAAELIFDVAWVKARVTSHPGMASMQINGDCVAYMKSLEAHEEFDPEWGTHGFTLQDRRVVHAFASPDTPAFYGFDSAYKGRAWL